VCKVKGILIGKLSLNQLGVSYKILMLSSGMILEIKTHTRTMVVQGTSNLKLRNQVRNKKL